MWLEQEKYPFSSTKTTTCSDIARKKKKIVLTIAVCQQFLKSMAVAPVWKYEGGR